MPTSWGVVSEESCTTTVFRNTGDGPEHIAKFYGRGKSKQIRLERSESMAAVFIQAMRDSRKPSANLRKTLRAAIMALHKGAVRWNESGSKGHKFAGLIALFTDGLLCPWYYLNGGKDDA